MRWYGWYGGTTRAHTIPYSTIASTEAKDVLREHECRLSEKVEVRLRVAVISIIEI